MIRPLSFPLASLYLQKVPRQVIGCKGFLIVLKQDDPIKTALFKAHRERVSLSSPKALISKGFFLLLKGTTMKVNKLYTRSQLIYLQPILLRRCHGALFAGVQLIGDSIWTLVRVNPLSKSTTIYPISVFTRRGLKLTKLNSLPRIESFSSMKNSNWLMPRLLLFHSLFLWPDVRFSHTPPPPTFTYAVSLGVQELVLELIKFILMYLYLIGIDSEVDSDMGLNPCLI